MAKSIYDSLEYSQMEKRGFPRGFRDAKKSSPCFEKVRVSSGEQRKTVIMDQFKISNRPLFEKKYAEASTGDGNPIKDFDAFKSSALCALLLFYQADNLEIDGVKYTKSFFEVRNRVIPGQKPSNMDVVLVNDKDDTILFLECKFSEYFSRSPQKVSNKYMNENIITKKLYQHLFDKKKAETCSCGSSFCFNILDKYSEGIKQIISHLLGITNFLDIENDENYIDLFEKHFVGHNDERRKIYKKYNRVIFKEILFAFNDYDKDLKILNGYINLSKLICKEFVDNKLIDERIIIAEPSTYQDIFHGDNLKSIETPIREFYKLK